jgi:transposase
LWTPERALKHLSAGICFDQCLGDAPRSGKPPKVTVPYRQRLCDLVRQRPRALDLPFSLWTAARLADRLAEETGLRMSVPSIHRLLREAGLGFSRPQHRISSPDPEYAVKKRRSRLSGTG